jgi:hypothetical protein
MNEIAPGPALAQAMRRRLRRQHPNPRLDIGIANGREAPRIARVDRLHRRAGDLSQIVIDKFTAHEARIFASAGDWERHLQALSAG